MAASEPLSGGCLCGATRYRSTERADHASVCHCRSCQRDSGAPMVAWVTVPRAGFEFEGLEPLAYESSPGVWRHHCRRCGSALTYRSSAAPQTLDVTLATLDDGASPAPDRHIWVSHKVPWLRLDDGLPQYAEWSTES